MSSVATRSVEQPAWIVGHPRTESLAELFVSNSHRTSFLQTPFSRFVEQKLADGYRAHDVYDMLLRRIDVRTGVKANPTDFPTQALYLGHQLDKLELLGR